MSSDPLRTEAAANLQRHLAENAYPGRGLILGRSTSGAWTIVYWLMGRSNNSRNRVLLEENGLLRTEAADPAQLEDPSLIIYNALRTLGGKTVVTNGDHTDRVVRGSIRARRQGYAKSPLNAANHARLACGTSTAPWSTSFCDYAQGRHNGSQPRRLDGR